MVKSFSYHFGNDIGVIPCNLVFIIGKNRHQVKTITVFLKFIYAIKAQKGRIIFFNIIINR